MENEYFTIHCPCCEAILKIDASTGAILLHEEKKKTLGSFEEMVKGLDKQKQHREDIFSQQMNAEKDRERLLAEKFKEAMKHADEVKDLPFINPMDLD